MKRRLKISINAPVTIGFVLLAFIATLLGTLSGWKITNAFFMTYHSSLLSPMTYVRLFTHVLGHSGWEHFIGHTMYLLMIGPMLEEKYGTKVIVETILITALITGLVNYILFPSVGLCGASGVVFAFILLASFTNFKRGELPLSFILVATIYISQQVYEGIAVRDNISNITHIVGGLVGSVIGYNLNRRK